MLFCSEHYDIANFASSYYLYQRKNRSCNALSYVMQRSYCQSCRHAEHPSIQTVSQSSGGREGVGLFHLFVRSFALFLLFATVAVLDKRGESRGFAKRTWKSRSWIGNSVGRSGNSLKWPHHSTHIIAEWKKYEPTDIFWLSESTNEEVKAAATTPGERQPTNGYEYLLTLRTRFSASGLVLTYYTITSIGSITF